MIHSDVLDESGDAMAVAIASLGCPKNLVESETLLAQLAEAGFAITGEYGWADVIIVNTCGFLKLAQQEAADAIDQLVQYKVPQGRCRCLVVAGCWSQIGAKEIRSRWPEVDAVIGVNDRRQTVDAILDVLFRQQRIVRASRQPGAMIDESVRFRLTPRHWAYLRISEGCSQQCSFCTIPRIRGRYRSKPPRMVLGEARQLIASGARELILIGQETTHYGHDLGGRITLAGLLTKLNRLDGIDWLRVMYAHPANFDERTIGAIADLNHVVKYIDLPLQHINDTVLKRMKRPTNREGIESLLDRLRRKIPGVTIRTTMIVGFPGETYKQFEELLEFVRQVEFDVLGAFMFSPEHETSAARMREQVDDQAKLERLDRLMRAQRRIARRKAKEWIGRKFHVYVESTNSRSKYVIARHSRQAPEVDPETRVRCDGTIAVSAGPGSKLRVECVSTRGYDLIAVPC